MKLTSIEEIVKELEKEFPSHGTAVVEAGAVELSSFIRENLTALLDAMEEEVVRGFKLDPPKKSSSPMYSRGRRDAAAIIYSYRGKK